MTRLVTWLARDLDVPEQDVLPAIGPGPFAFLIGACFVAAAFVTGPA